MFGLGSAWSGSSARCLFLGLLMQLKRKKPESGRGRGSDLHRVGDIPLDGARMGANAFCCDLIQAFVALLVSDGGVISPPPPAGLLHCLDVLFAVTSGMSRW